MDQWVDGNIVTNAVSGVEVKMVMASVGYFEPNGMAPAVGTSFWCHLVIGVDNPPTGYVPVFTGVFLPPNVSLVPMAAAPGCTLQNNNTGTMTDLAQGDASYLSFCALSNPPFPNGALSLGDVSVRHEIPKYSVFVITFQVVATAPVSGQTIRGYVDTGAALWGTLSPQVTLNTASQAAPPPSAGRIAYKGFPQLPLIELIETMKFDGTDVRRLVSSDQTMDVHVGNPVWSPDGTRLLFASYRALPSAPKAYSLHIFVMDAATGANQQVLIQSGHLSSLNSWTVPRWSWDGTRLLLSALTTWPIAGEPTIDSFSGSCWSVWVMDSSGGGQSPLTDGANGLSPVWVGQDQVACIVAQKDIQVIDVILHMRGTNDTYPYKYDTSASVAYSLDSNWWRSDLASSPEHGILAFTATSAHDPNDQEIHLWNSSVGEWSIGKGSYPTFSPDGNWVAYSKPNWQLVMNDLSGQRERVIASKLTAYNDWSSV